MSNDKILLTDTCKENIKWFNSELNKNTGIETANCDTMDSSINFIKHNQDISMVVANIDIISIEDSISIAKNIKIDDFLYPLVIITKDTKIRKEYDCKRKIIDFITMPNNEIETLALSHRLELYSDSYSTKRKLQKEIEKRQKMEQKYKGLIEFTNTGYMILDTNFRILEINDNIQNILGMQKEDILNCNPRSFITSEDIKKFDYSMSGLLKGGLINDLELCINSKTKSSHISLNATLLVNGEDRIFCLVRDIADRKKEEAKIYIRNQRKKDEIMQSIKEVKESFKKDLFKVAAL